MAPESETYTIWVSSNMLAVFPNTGYFPCLDPQCHRLVDRMELHAASVRQDMMTLKGPLETAKNTLAKLAPLCFCSKHRKDRMHEDEILAKHSEWGFAIESVLEERGKFSEGEVEVRDLKRELKKAKQEEARVVTRLLDEMNGLKERLQRTSDENGMLRQQIAADDQRSTEKQMTTSKKMSQLQRQVSEVKGAKNVGELANTVYAREKKRLERELERIKKIAVCSREVRIKEINELKEQLQDSGTHVEEADRHIGDLKSQLEESNARLDSMKRETSEDIRELKGQLDRERGTTMELNELTNQLKERNIRLEESKSHYEFMERQNTAEMNKLRDQLDKSNTSLEDLRRELITEASELKDQLTCCKDIFAELKAAGSANIVQAACVVNRYNYILEDCQTKIACDTVGTRQFTDSDDAVEHSKAAGSREKKQLTEEVHALKEQLRDVKAASTMPTSVLQTMIQKLRMWSYFLVRRSYVHLLFKQGKVEQVETAKPALSDEVLSLREQARDVDRRLASQLEKISVLKRRNVKQDVASICNSFLVILSVFKGC